MSSPGFLCVLSHPGQRRNGHGDGVGGRGGSASDERPRGLHRLNESRVHGRAQVGQTDARGVASCTPVSRLGGEESLEVDDPLSDVRLGGGSWCSGSCLLTIPDLHVEVGEPVVVLEAHVMKWNNDPPRRLSSPPAAILSRAVFFGSGPPPAAPDLRARERVRSSGDQGLPGLTR